MWTCLVGVRTEAKVLDGLACVLGAAEQQGVGASRGAHGDLVDREALAAGLDNARAGGGSEAERSNGELGHLQEAVVVRHWSNQDNGLALVCFARVLVCGGRNDAGKGHGRAVDLAHHQAAQDDLVELGVGPAGEESVELDQEGQIRVLRLLDLAVAALDVMEI